MPPGDKPRTWTLQDAEARFDELVRRAVDEGPQHVTITGGFAVVVLSEREYNGLFRGKPTVVDDLLGGEPWPDDVVDAVLARRRGPDRPVDL